MDSIRQELLKSFPNAKIDYQYSNDLHKLQLYFEHFTQTLILERKTVEESTPMELLNLLNIYQIIKNFKDNPKPKQILLTRKGSKEKSIEI